MFEYSPEIQQKITIAIYSIIASGVVSFAIGYYLGKKNIKYQEKLWAERELRNAFVPIMIELDEIRDFRKDGYSQGDFPTDIIKRHFDKHEVAIKRFADFLKKRKRKDFIKAWEEYVYPNKKFSESVHDDELNQIPSDEYFSTYPPEIVKIRKRLRNKISVILSFAKFQ